MKPDRPSSLRLECRRSLLRRHMKLPACPSPHALRDRGALVLPHMPGRHKLPGHAATADFDTLGHAGRLLSGDRLPPEISPLLFRSAESRVGLLTFPPRSDLSASRATAATRTASRRFVRALYWPFPRLEDAPTRGWLKSRRVPLSKVVSASRRRFSIDQALSLGCLKCRNRPPAVVDFSMIPSERKFVGVAI